MITKPMLAASIKEAGMKLLKYPMMASLKIDGIRCLRIDDKVVSRTFKPIPNDYIRWCLSKIPSGLDGELVVGDTFQSCTSGVMTQKGEPDFTYCVFDYVKDTLTEPYVDRLKNLLDVVGELNNPRVVAVDSKFVYSEKEILEYEKVVLLGGYEGVILRHPAGPYKCGRSTVKQAYLLKLKRFLDSEAEIIGFEEMMHNDNEREKDELGYAKRSSAKAGKVKAGMLGKFVVQDIHSGVKFSIGTGLGLTQKLRLEIWKNKESYIGKLVKYRYQPVGTKDAPRIPVWLGFRGINDL